MFEKEIKQLEYASHLQKFDLFETVMDKQEDHLNLVGKYFKAISMSDDRVIQVLTPLSQHDNKAKYTCMILHINSDTKFVDIDSIDFGIYGADKWLEIPQEVYWVRSYTAWY